MANWQIITVAPNAEGRVSQTLATLELDHHIFRIRRKIVLRGQIVDRLSPAFSGYVFAACEARFEVVRKVIGVIDFVRFGDCVAELSESFVDALAASCPNQILPVPDSRESTRFKRGDRVKIRSFAFDAEGVFEEMIAPDRALVLLDWMGRMVHASVSERELSLDKLDSEGINARPKRRRRPRWRRHGNGSSPAKPLGPLYPQVAESPA